MKLDILKGKTDVTVYVFIQDSSSTVGAGLTGLVFNSASLVAYYVRPLGNATSIPLVTQTVTGAHTDGGFVEVSAANMPGVYRLDLPDGVVATGVPSAVVELKGATNMAPVTLELQLVAYDPEDAADLGLTALTGHTPQTGDSFARIGANGASLSAIPWNAAWDAEVESEVTDALVAAQLDQKVIRRATAQAGGASTITLDASASATNDLYQDAMVVLLSGTGAGQQGVITQYAGATKVATVSKSWAVQPDGTTVFELRASGVKNANIRRWLETSVNALVSGRVDSSVGAVAANAITAAAIASAAITAAKFGAGAIDAAAIATDAIEAAKIATGAITSAKFAAGAIDAASIASNAIADTKIATGAITSAKFAASAINAAAIATDALAAAKLATDAVNKIRDAIISDATAFAGANIALIRDSQVVRRNTAQAVAAGTITLDASASAENDAYRFHRVRVVSATTGVGQIRYITDYVGSTKVATLASNWDITPTGTVVFEVLPGMGTDLATVQNIADSVVFWKKNTARSNFAFGMYNTSGGLVTGLTVTAQRRIDAAASFTTLTNAVTEIGTTGVYTVDITAAELNGDLIALKLTASGAVSQVILIQTKV